MQYFYLVMVNGCYDEPTYPVKVFMQFEQALKFARKYAIQFTKSEDLYSDWQYVDIYRQPMTSTGEMELMDVEITPFA